MGATVAMMCGKLSRQSGQGGEIPAGEGMMSAWYRWLRWRFDADRR